MAEATPAVLSPWLVDSLRRPQESHGRGFAVQVRHRQPNRASELGWGKSLGSWMILMRRNGTHIPGEPGGRERDAQSKKEPQGLLKLPDPDPLLPQLTGQARKRLEILPTQLKRARWSQGPALSRSAPANQAQAPYKTRFLLGLGTVLPYSFMVRSMASLLAKRLDRPGRPRTPRTKASVHRLQILGSTKAKSGSQPDVPHIRFYRKLLCRHAHTTFHAKVARAVCRLQARHLQTPWPGGKSQGQLSCGQEPRGCGEVRRARLITGETQRPWFWVCAGEGSRPHHVGPGNQMFSQLRLRAEHKPAEKPMAGGGR